MSHIGCLRSDGQKKTACSMYSSSVDNQNSEYQHNIKGKAAITLDDHYVIIYLQMEKNAQTFLLISESLKKKKV